MKLLGILLLLVALTIPGITSLARKNKLGEKPCTQGPSYWCSHIDKAKECNAVEYCASKEWKPSAAKNNYHKVGSSSVDSIPCQMCKSLVENIKKSTKKHKTLGQTINSASFTCLLGKKVQLSHCQHLVKTYTSEIHTMLVNNMNENEICSIIGDCGTAVVKSQTKKIASAHHQLPSKEVPSCQKCQKTVIAMNKIQKTMNSEVFVTFMKEKLCHSKIKSSHCGKMVDVFVPALFQNLLGKLVPHEVCTHLGHCENLMSIKMDKSVSFFNVNEFKMHVNQQINKKGMQLGDGILCEACELVLDELRVLAGNNATQEEMENFLMTKVCDKLPNTEKQICEKIVVQVLPTILNELANKTQPYTICTSLKFCDGNGTKTNYNIELVLKNIDIVRRSQKFHGRVSYSGSNNNNKAVSISQTRVADYCETCETIVHYVETLVSRNASVAEIEKLLEKICNFLPAKMRTECDTIVVNYTPLIVQLIAKDLTPQQICHMIGLCQSATFTLLVKHLNIENQLQEMRKNNKAVVVSSAPNDLCTTCTTIVHYMESLLAANATEQEIEVLLQRICSFLPQKDRDECDLIVKDYALLILQYILNGLTPQHVCQLMQLCPNNINDNSKVSIPMPSYNQQQQTVKSKSKSHSSAKERSLECDLCHTMVEHVEKAVAANATEEQIERFLNKICSFLPTQDQQKCANAIHTHLKEVINMVIKKMTPQQVCLLIRLCPNSNKDHSKVSVSKPETVKLKSKSHSSLECDLCHTMVEHVEKALAANATEQEIETFLDKICSFLPTEDQQKCTNAIHMYLPAVINMVINKATPQQICLVLGVCTSSNNNQQHQQVIKKTQQIIQSHKNKVWSALQDNKECEVCQVVVHYVELLVTDQETEKGIISLLDLVCSKLPSKDQETECTKLVNKFLPSIMVLVETVQPREICTLIATCKNSINFETALKSTFNMNVPAHKQHSSLSARCQFCASMVEYVRSNPVRRRTGSVIFKDVAAICPEDPQLLKECKVSSSKASPSSAIKKLPAQSSGLCDTCTLVVTFAEKYLQENATEKQIEEVLLKICLLFPGKLKTDCDSFVAQYTPALVQLLAKGLPPSTVCQVLGLCPKQSKQQPISKQLTSSTECDTCKLVVGYAEQLVTANATVSEIEAVLDKICSLFPATFRTECDSFVSKYTPELLALLAKGLSPEAICELIGLCPKQTDTKLNSIQAKQHPIMTLPSSTECDTCKLVVGYAEQLVTANATESEIEALLDKLCSLFPATFRNECDSFVSKYTPELLALLAKGLSPEEICELIGLCPKTQQATEALKQSASACDTCKLVASYAENLLTKNATVEEIERVLDQICSLLPTEYKTECESFISKYTLDLLELLAKDIPAETFCKLLRLCPNTMKLGHQNEHHFAAVVEKQRGSVITTVSSEAISAECELCTVVITFAELLVTKNATATEIEAVLDKVCILLPESYQTKCRDFVSTYTPELLQLIARGLPAGKVCELIKMCTAATYQHHTKRTNIQPQHHHDWSEKMYVPDTVDTKCWACGIMMGLTSSLKAKNLSVLHITNGLLEFCAAFPEHDKRVCTYNVREHTQAVVNMLNDGQSGREICEHFKACAHDTPLSQFVSGTSNQLFMVAKCSHGPTFWCSSQISAHLCGAVSYCQANLWKRQ